jgi:hypothetical protein
MGFLPKVKNIFKFKNLTKRDVTFLKKTMRNFVRGDSFKYKD